MGLISSSWKTEFGFILRSKKLKLHAGPLKYINVSILMQYIHYTKTMYLINI